MNYKFKRQLQVKDYLNFAWSMTIKIPKKNLKIVSTQLDLLAASILQSQQEMEFDPFLKRFAEYTVKNGCLPWKNVYKSIATALFDMSAEIKELLLAMEYSTSSSDSSS